MQKGSYLKILLELGKVRISLPVALSALTGYLMFTKKLDQGAWLLAFGVFLVSCGSSAFNHFQEREQDALMPRTKKRPIPSKRLSAIAAFVVATTYTLIGLALLYLFLPTIAMWLSLFTLVTYNLVYTPLKKVTAFAVLPGSLTGALPPLIGWAAAGGSLFDQNILLVGSFFFLGQVPHFWLLLLMFGEQYQLASMPSLNQVFNPNQIKRLTFTWILTTISSALLVIHYVFGHKFLYFLLLIYILYLLFSFTKDFLVQKEFKARPAFFKLNFLYLFMMFFLMMDSLLGKY